MTEVMESNQTHIHLLSSVLFLPPLIRETKSEEKRMMKIREGWEQELLVARYASRSGFTKCFDHLLSCLSLSEVTTWPDPIFVALER